MKKLFFAILLCGIFVVTGCSTYKQMSALELFCIKHNIKDIDYLPTGVTPIRFDSEQEFMDYIIALENSLKTSKLVTVKAISNEGTVRISAYKQYTGGKIWLEADVYIINYTDRPGICQDCHEWTRPEGLVFGFQWNQTYCYHQFSSDQRSCGVYGGGNLDAYLLVQGFLKFYTWKVDLQTGISAR